jgi:hypothetical protein
MLVRFIVLIISVVAGYVIGNAVGRLVLIPVRP